MPRVARTPRRSPRPAPQDRPGWWKLQWRRQRRRLRPVAAVLALFAVLLGGLYAAQALAVGASFRERLGQVTGRLGLRVADIVIEGRQKTPEPLLRAAIGVRGGDPILAFSVADARARIETIAWVEHATVERRLPGTIVVQLAERRPFAVWQHDGKFVVIDRAGEIVGDSDVAAFAGQLPLVVGPGAPSAAAALLDALADQPQLASRVAASVRVGERRWTLHLASGTDVLLPEGAEVAALRKLAELQSEHALLDRPLKVVDLRLADRLVIRPAAEPAAAPPADPKAKKPT